MKQKVREYSSNNWCAFQNVQSEIIKLQRNGLHLNCSVNFGNLKLRSPLTFGIKSKYCGNKNLGQIIQIRNCYSLKFKNL